MIIIKILSDLRSREVHGQRGSFTVRYHEAELIQPDRRPRYVEVTPPKGTTYTVGALHTVAPHSVRTNDFDKLVLARYVDFVRLADVMDFVNKTMTQHT